MKKKYAILGAGNGGQSISAYLKLKGNEVYLYDRYQSMIDPIKEKGNIELTGVSLNGTAKLDKITTDIEDAVKGADFIFVVVPSNAHAYIAEALSPILENGQVILLCPGSTGGVLEFKKILDDKKCKARIKLGETSSLFYACRASEGIANISGIKEELKLASLPSSDADYIIEALEDLYPQLIKAENVLETSLANLNAIMHPLPVLLSSSWIEATKGDFRFYYDSITPSVGAIVEKLDLERMAIGRALGVEVVGVIDTLKKQYSAKGNDLYETVRSVSGYSTIKAPPSLESRLLFEDIPMGLVPMAELAKFTNVKTPLMDMVINLSSEILDRDFKEEGRSLDKLGVSKMDLKQFKEYIQ